METATKAEMPAAALVAKNAIDQFLSDHGHRLWMDDRGDLQRARRILSYISEQSG